MHIKHVSHLPRRVSTLATRQRVLVTYQCIAKESAHPSKRYTFTNLIKACGNEGDLDRGKKLHADAQNEGFMSDAFVASAIVSMYGKCGCIVEAEDAFSAVFQPDTVLWNALLAAYIKQGEGEKTLLLYRQLQEEGICANLLTFVSAIQACGILAEQDKFQNAGGHPVKRICLEIGRALHSEAHRKGFTKDARINTTLVSMYAKCGTLLEAENVFSLLSLHSVVLWNAILSAYVERGQVEKVLWLYRQMQLLGMKPDHLTIVFSLQACRILAEREAAFSMQGQSTKDGPLKIGRALHAAAQSKGFTESVFVGTTLVNVYGKCNSIVDAEEVFSSMSQRTVVSWNSMLSAYVEQGHVGKALLLYRQMQEDGVTPDQQTVVFALQACGILMEREKALAKGQVDTLLPILEVGQALHAEVRNMGFVL